MNNQIPLKPSKISGEFLSLHSVFNTIQGEGPFAGTPATFIRLGGCNLQCPGCDTEYTEGSQMVSYMEIVDRVFDLGVSPAKLVVITGGEPFRQDLTYLVNWLLRCALHVQIETNGTLAPKLTMLLEHPHLTIVCSPKTPTINPEIRSRADAFKYVAKAGDISYIDGLPNHALDLPGKQLARPGAGIKVYIQPMDEQNAERNAANLAACQASALKFGYTLCIQLHKILGVE